MKHRLVITSGLFILVLISAGCGSDSLKSSFFQSRPETALLEEPSSEPTENPETNCSSLNPHPIAEGITEKFSISYDEVMTIYCDGYAFSDILLALETEQLVDQSVEDLLSLLETRSWEEIWSELGVKPE